MPKVLICDDDKVLCEQLQEWLTFERFTVELAHTGGDAKDLLKRFKYDVIILDWQLPEHNGPDILADYRAGGGSTPVLMLTGMGAVTDKTTGLDAGADDYVTKPVHPKELTARLRALLRRTGGYQPNVLEVGDITLEQQSYRVTRGGKDIKLQPKEFAILEFLMRHPGQAFGSKALLENVWESESTASEDTIRSYMKTLRRKIADEAGNSPIVTVPGYGYKLDFSSGSGSAPPEIKE